MAASPPTPPDWDRLYEIAASQDGLFTTHQAAQAGYSPQLLAHHLGAGRMMRIRRGIYRLVHFPAGDHEDLTAVWLWSEREGVFSHQTALALHDLSDVLPAQVHLTLPAAWRRRRLRVPEGVVLHFANVGRAARRWFGPVPATDPRRTLEDCAAEHLAPELLRSAAVEALDCGLVTRAELAAASDVLEPFGDSAHDPPVPHRRRLQAGPRAADPQREHLGRRLCQAPPARRLRPVPGARRPRARRGRHAEGRARHRAAPRARPHHQGRRPAPHGLARGGAGTAASRVPA